MPQEIVRQVNFNVGELDPMVSARSDLKIYFAGMELAENLVTTPVGPLIRRPGSTFIDKVRHVLDPVPFTEDQAGAPEGGFVIDIVSADSALFETTTSMGAADMVLLQIDFGMPVDVALIDVVDFAAKAGGGGAPTPIPPPFVFPFLPPGGFVGGEIGGGFLP